MTLDKMRALILEADPAAMLDGAADEFGFDLDGFGRDAESGIRFQPGRGIVGAPPPPGKSDVGQIGSALGLEADARRRRRHGRGPMNMHRTQSSGARMNSVLLNYYQAIEKASQDMLEAARGGVQVLAFPDEVDVSGPFENFVAL